jgi:hypothetical protein
VKNTKTRKQSAKDKREKMKTCQSPNTQACFFIVFLSFFCRLSKTHQTKSNKTQQNGESTKKGQPQKNEKPAKSLLI